MQCNGGSVSAVVHSDVNACNGASVVLLGQWSAIAKGGRQLQQGRLKGGRLLGQGQSPPPSCWANLPSFDREDAIANDITQLSQDFNNTGWERRTGYSSQKRSQKIKAARKKTGKRKKVAVQEWLPLQDLLPGSRRRLLGEEVTSPTEIVGEGRNFREPASAGGVAGGLWLLQS